VANLLDGLPRQAELNRLMAIGEFVVHSDLQEGAIGGCRLRSLYCNSTKPALSSPIYVSTNRHRSARPAGGSYGANLHTFESLISERAVVGSQLLYLPSYSPHLNLIERFWRYVRKECLYSKYYPKFDGFKQALTECIQNAHTKHRDELETLLAWNFQSFEKVKISTV